MEISAHSSFCDVLLFGRNYNSLQNVWHKRKLYFSRPLKGKYSFTL